MNKNNIIFIVAVAVLLIGISLSYFGVSIVPEILMIVGMGLAIYNSFDHKKAAINSYKSAQNRVKEKEHTIKELEQKVEKLEEKIETTEKINEMSQKHLLQIQKAESSEALANDFITSICDDLEASKGAFFLANGNSIEYAAGFAYSAEDDEPIKFQMGEGLVGQVAQDKKTLNLKDIPEDYVEITSGLGKAKPKNIFIQPIVYDNVTLGVYELATFKKLSDEELLLLNLVSNNVATKLSSFTN